jgi:hypothetical protein
MPELSGAVRGEKEWQGWAQDHVDWGSKQANVASERPPYNSTLVQTGNYDLAGVDGPGMPSLSGVVQGEKDW